MVAISEHGFILAVTDEVSGDYLFDDVFVGDTALVLGSVDVFAETGGRAILDDGANSEPVIYTNADRDTATLTIESPLTNDYLSSDTAVTTYPAQRTRWAYVQLDDPDEPAVRARVPFSMSGQVPLGQRSDVIGEGDTSARPPESVLIDQVRGTWVVVDILHIVPDIGTTDGSPPPSSPNATVEGGPGFLAVRWDGISNPDRVTYDVYLSSVSGFTPDDTTKVAESDGTLLFIRTLPDGSPLLYDTDYYVVTVARDPDGEASPSSQSVGRLVPATSSDIAANAITANQILAGAVTADKLEAVLQVVNKLLFGAPTGAHGEADSAGIRLYAADGVTPTVELPTDSETDPYFQGRVVAEELDITGDARFRGANSSLAASSVFTLESGVTDPLSSPIATISYPVATTLNNKLHFGLHYDADGSDAGGVEVFWTTEPGGSGYYRLVQEWEKDTGTLLRQHDLGVGNDAWGVVRMGAFIYILWSPNDTTTWNIRRISQDSPTLTGGTTINISSRVVNDNPGLMTDGTHIYVITTSGTGVGAHIRLVKFDAAVAFVANVELDAAFVVDGRSGGLATEFGGGVQVSEAAVNGGDPTWWVAMYSYPNSGHLRRSVHAFDVATGDHIVDDDWYGELGAEADGIAHDGTNFYSLVFNGDIVQHSNWTWVTESWRYWVGFTYYDSDATGGTHETAVSPRTTLQMHRRGFLSVGWGTIPDQGGTDDPDKVRLYVARGGTEPQASGRFDGQLQAAFSGTSTLLDDFDTTGAQNPAANDFPSSTAAQLRSAVTGFLLTGDGRFVLPHSDAEPASPDEAEVFFDTDNHSPRVWDTYTWKNLARGGPAMAKQTVFEEDFFQQLTGAAGLGLHGDTNIGYGPFRFTISGAGGTTTNITSVVQDPQSHPGVVELATGDSSGGRCRFFSHGTILFGGGAIHYRAWVRIPTLSTTTEAFYTTFGYMSAENPSTNTNGVWISSENGNSPHWRGYVANNATDASPTDLGAIVVGEWYLLDIVVDAGGSSVDFYINNSPTTRAATCPQVAGRETGVRAGILKTAGTASRSVQLDALSHAQRLSGDGRL